MPGSSEENAKYNEGQTKMSDQLKNIKYYASIYELYIKKINEPSLKWYVH